jgi:hypothetical protein
MKKLLTLPVLLVLYLNPFILQAQNCDFADAGVRFNYSTTDPATGNCLINIDLYYDLRTNSGSKYVNMHIWPASGYPDINYANPPDSVQLAGSITMMVHHFQNHSFSHLDSVYKPDTRVIPQYMNMELRIGPSSTPNYDRYVITNINLVVPGGCAIPQSFKLDIWSTESESMNHVHCFEKGNSFYANNPRVIGLMNCNLPRTYNVQLFSIDPLPMTVNYDVYIDNGDNVFNTIEDTLKIEVKTGIVINSTTSYSSGTLPYLPYSNIYPYANMNLWVEVKSTALPNSVIYLIENTCSALPVQFKWFKAERRGEIAMLTWVTATETGNKGFAIEKRSGETRWHQTGFMPSATPDGNSQAELFYTYQDPLPEQGSVQYRLKQIDINGGYYYSPVRVIEGKKLKGSIVFPNPSSGSITIVFAEPGTNYKVNLYNMEGRIIDNRQHASGILKMDELARGVYFLQIIKPGDKIVETLKIVVQ